MFTIKAIRYEKGTSETDSCEVQEVNHADYYHIRKGKNSAGPSVIGYSRDGAITCHHEVFDHSDSVGSLLRCDVVYISNISGRTIDRIDSEKYRQARASVASIVSESGY